MNTDTIQNEKQTSVHSVMKKELLYLMNRLKYLYAMNERFVLRVCKTICLSSGNMDKYCEFSSCSSAEKLNIHSMNLDDIKVDDEFQQIFTRVAQDILDLQVRSLSYNKIQYIFYEYVLI